MKLQVTRRSECSEVDEQERSKVVLTQKVEVKAAKRVPKRLARFLLNPSTWRWFIVYAPEIWGKIEAVFKHVFAWFSDFF